MVTLISRCPEETAALGETWGRQAEAGQVFALTGDLGAGKTQLVRGLARGLEIPGRVRSPTFALVLEYPGGRLPLHHLDLYRLESLAAIQGAGLDDYLWPRDGVTVVEWAERWLDAPGQRPAQWPARLRRVWLECLGEHERRIAYEDAGA